MLNSVYKEIACALLRGENCDWPDGLSEQEFISFLQSQGVLLLLSENVEQIEAQCPKSVHQAVVIAQAAGVSLFEQRTEVVRNLFARFNQEQIKAVLFKGAANAYLLYPRPILRQHADIDILINVKDYSAAVNLLVKMDFNVDDIKPTKFGPYQTTATLPQLGKPDVLVDLHWKINNRLLLANTLSFEQARKNALPIPSYGEQVYGLDYKSALIAACIHEAGSLPVEREKLIGLYDVHLLVKKLGKHELHNVLTAAEENRISEICLEYIKKAISTFGSQQQVQILTELKSKFNANNTQPSSMLMKHDRSWLEDQKLDWLAVKGAANKIEYIISKFSRKFLG